MTSDDNSNQRAVGRYVGLSLAASIVIGIVSAVFISRGIDINLNADVSATAQNMLESELRLRAKAYTACLVFVLGVIVNTGLFLLLRKWGTLLAASSLCVGLSAAVLALLGAVFAMNAAEFSGDPAYRELATESQRVLLAALQATSDYTSFHLGLVLSSAAMAGFFLLFVRSGLIPKIIAGWGLFASVFVATAIVARDFIPVIGHGAITTAFMLSNLIALVATALYLSVFGVRRLS